MDGTRGKRRIGFGLLALAAGICGCQPPATIEDLPTPQATLATAGKRLSQSLSADALTALATQGDRVLAALTTSERDALARGGLRFGVDRPTEIYVAAPRDSAPYWLADQRFEPTGWTLRVNGSEWIVSRKTFVAGMVGLGVNGLDQTASAHYAVFLRATDGSNVVPAPLDSDWHATTAAEGVSMAVGVSLPVEALPSALRGAVLLQPRHDLRHATTLAQGRRVWKTHVPAARRPDQVTVAFGEEPMHELIWSWRTAPGVTESLVRLRPPSDATDQPRVVWRKCEAVETPDVLNDPVVLHHTVQLSGLEAGATYAYSVGDGTDAGSTEWRSVRTAPVPGGDFSLMYMGDPQCGLEGWGKLLEGAFARQPDVGALLIAGDLVDRGNERTNWDHFFLRAAKVFGRVPVMPCVGNHEYLDRGPRLYRALFDLPDNGPASVDRDLVYSFDYADAFIAVLDSTRAVFDPAEARRQAEWLDRALAKTDRTWKFVMFHHPVYASHVWRLNPTLEAAWVPVIDRHHVDLVLQGHDHAYLRTYPMRENRRAESPSEGTVYVVAVSGDKYCDQDARDYGAVGLTNVSTYQTIDVSARDHRLTFRARDAGGREVDRFVIDKTKRGVGLPMSAN